jgi:hypothetical protein
MNDEVIQTKLCPITNERHSRGSYKDVNHHQS